jgi:predicted nucleotidyltransferase
VREANRTARILAEALTPRELRAARRVVEAVLRWVPAELVQASIFGSRARGEARPDSDLDVLLLFARLPPDREPHATMAEELAAGVAGEMGVPVAVWSVSLVDLYCGNRTPMLVDALEDAIPLWWRRRPLPPLPLTPPDALGCVGALLERVAEGSAEFAAMLEHGQPDAAARRARNDLTRLCTAGLLLRGITRPRRGAAVRAFTRLCLPRDASPEMLPVLRWAAASFGAGGRDEDAPLRRPPGGLEAAARVVGELRRYIVRGARHLSYQLRGPRFADCVGRNGTCSHLRPAGMTPDPSQAPARS